MNCRKWMGVALVAMVALGTQQAVRGEWGLDYPVAYDDQNGPTFYRGPVMTAYSPADQGAYSPVNPALYRPMNQVAYSPVNQVGWSAGTAVTQTTYEPRYVPTRVVERTVVPAAHHHCCEQPLPRPALPPYTMYRPAPYMAYTPVAAAAPAGPKVIVRPKIVYVEGQPIRNFLRALTP